MKTYCTDSKSSDTQVWANSVDPDQTAPKEQSIRVYMVCYSVCIFWTQYSVIKPHRSIFRTIQHLFRVLNFFFYFYCTLGEYNVS